MLISAAKAKGNRLTQDDFDAFQSRYDLDDDALYNGILYTDGVIEFSDKYDNNYYVYEKEENGYYKYYTLANGDLEACLKDEMKHNDITKVIRRGLNKSKQNKK